MAEALVAVGAIASAVQITDCVCRLTKVLHGRYEAFSNSEENIARLKRTLEDFELVARNIRLYQAKHASSVAATVEHEVLPNVITRLEGCQAELELLREINDAAKPITSSVRQVKKLGRRIKWVYDEKKTAASLLRLEQHKTTLMLAMQPIGLCNDIKFRRDIHDLRSDIVAHAQDTAVYNEQSSRSIDALRNQVNRNGEEQTGTLAGLCTSYDAHARQFIAYSEDSLARQQQQLNLLQHVPATAKKVDNLASEFARFSMSAESFRAETRASTLSADAFVRLFRQQIMVVLPEMKEQVMSQTRAESRGWVREEFERLPKALAEVMKEALQHYTSDSTLANPTRDQDDEIKFPDGFVDEPSEAGRPLRGLVTHSTQQIEQVRSTTPGVQKSPTRDAKLRANRKTWSFKWRFGILRVSLARSFVEYDGTETDSGVFEANIDFVPAPWLFRRGFLLLYTSSPDLRGYAIRCPTISTFAVIPRNSAPFKCIKDGRVEDLQEMFDKRLAAPSDRDEDGYTLLNQAIWSADIDICRCLLAVGADPEVADSGSSGLNAMDTNLRLFILWLCDEDRKAQRARLSNFHLLQSATTRAAQDSNPVKSVNWFFVPFELDNPVLEFGFESMQMLKDVGYDFTAVDETGFTPIMYAAYGHNHNHVELLLEFGADVNVQSAYGTNVIHYTLECPQVIPQDPDRLIATLRLLIEAGCDISATDNWGYTPSAMALRLDAKAWRGITHRFELWTRALAECGIDIEDVLAAESEVRAQSTAIDRVLPKRDTLRRRKRPIEDVGEEDSDTVQQSIRRKR
ncbi:MAG: hypothetical protein M1836_006800 [Candelina mexicana]|nr:MAG: hypothetical protein M1836_006800 [Candelina mexicana]